MKTKYKKELIKDGYLVKTNLTIDEPKKCRICGKLLGFGDSAYFQIKGEKDEGHFYCLGCGKATAENERGWVGMIPVQLREE